MDEGPLMLAPSSSSLQCFTEERLLLTTNLEVHTLEEMLKKGFCSRMKERNDESKTEECPKVMKQDKYFNVIFKKNKISTKICISGASKMSQGVKILIM